VLFKCEFSTQALQAAGLEQYIVPCNQPCRSIHGSIQEICSSLDKKPTGLFAMLAWVLWNNCNNSVWNGMKEPRRNLAIKLGTTLMGRVEFGSAGAARPA
jgi:hypothetical protein